jgi:hypothetical protein
VWSIKLRHKMEAGNEFYWSCTVKLNLPSCSINETNAQTAVISLFYFTIHSYFCIYLLNGNVVFVFQKDYYCNRG